MSHHVCRIACVAVVLALGSAARSPADPPPLTPIPATTDKADQPAVYTPIVFKDAKTGITVYVETNGQYAAGIDADGKLLWFDNIVKKVVANAQPGAQIHIESLGRPGAFSPVDAVNCVISFSYPDLVRVPPLGLVEKETGVIDLHTGQYTSTGVKRGPAPSPERAAQPDISRRVPQ